LKLPSLVDKPHLLRRRHYVSSPFVRQFASKGPTDDAGAERPPFGNPIEMGSWRTTGRRLLGSPGWQVLPNPFRASYVATLCSRSTQVRQVSNDFLYTSTDAGYNNNNTSNCYRGPYMI
jgi:hypothetical protein